MTSGTSGLVVKEIRALYQLGPVGLLTDGQLLERFLDRRDESAEAAFAALVDRHGAMVLRVCRAELADPHEAQDAFQATFLVLARRAAAIRKAESLGSWLFGVARRIAARARIESARRRRHERRAAELSERSSRDDGPTAAVAAALEEVARLPEKYRRAVVLCDLEGLSYESAARQLGCPLGTVRSRLSRARNLLRSRLTRRGVAPALALLAGSVSDRVSAALSDATSRAAAQHAISLAATAGEVSARAATWASATARSMALVRPASAALVLMLTLAATGAGLRPGGPGSPQPQIGGDEASVKPPASERPLPSVSQIMDRALTIAAALNDPAERAETLLSLGRSQQRRGDVEAARRILGQAVEAALAIPPNAKYVYPHPIMRIARAQAEAGDRDNARQTFQVAAETIGAEDEGHQLQNWGNLPDIALKALGRNEAQVILGPYRHYLEHSEIVARDPSNRAISSAELKAREGHFVEAIRMAFESQEFRDERSRCVAFRQIAEALEPGDGALIDDVLTVARQAIYGQLDPLARNMDLCSFAELEARLGRIDRALLTAETIQPEAVPPLEEDMVKFNKAGAFAEIGDEQLKVGDRDGAIQSARKIVRIIEAIQQENYRPYRRSQAVHLLIAAGAEDEALRVASTDDRGPGADVLLEVAEARKKSGDQAGWRQALLDALKSAQRERQAADVPPADQQKRQNPDAPPFDDIQARYHLLAVTRTITRIQVKLGEKPDALRTIEDLEDAEARQEAFATLALDLALMGDRRGALQVIDRLDTPERRDRAWISVAAALPTPVGSRGGPDR